MEKPLLTIAIPTYKRPKYLYQAIKSAVEQSETSIPYDIIVVNNDPESDMADVKEAFTDVADKVTFYSNEKNIGMIGNVNRCVSLARGEYVAFLHDDDLLLPNYLSEIRPFLEEQKGSCLIPSRYLLFEGKSPSGKYKIEEKRKKKALLSSLFLPRYLFRRKFTAITNADNAFAWQNCYCAPTCGVVFKKDVILSRGLFFPEGTYSWDFISFFALNETEKIYLLHEPVSVYRMSTGASLRAEVQYDFYVAFEEMMGKYPAGSKPNRFINHYRNEIKYLNYASLNDAGKKFVAERCSGVVKECPSRFKFFLFMLKRMIHFSFNNLDVEMPLTNHGREVLKQMAVLSD
ncbi:glycosyltransferase family 2 protein [Sporomusa ovata]|uniref:glycosyltransferase family 2 protein n=1 Tax=Sporomusa ovata TaxID=2378 RepID=UPI00137878C7|nr:glycosyltransferase family 2 protein [Sporomusa ovata]